MKLYHAVSGAAFAAALLMGYAQFTTPVHAQTMSCTVSNVTNLKDRCPPGLTFGGASTAAPVMAEDASDEEPTITPVSSSSNTAGCIKTNVVNLKNACPW